MSSVQSLLHVGDIIGFWTQFGREGATATRHFRGITSCKIAVILYIILCIIKYEKNPELIVHYNALLSDMIFNKIIPNRLYSYFISQTNLSPDNVTVLDQSNFHDIIRICNILPVGLYDITSRVIKHYFLIVKFSESDYSIISAYGNERIQVELTEHPITLELLTQFVTNVNTGNIEYVRNFISRYFLNDNQTYIGEVSSYVGQLQLYYFHNIVGQIETLCRGYKAGGGYKKRKCMSLAMNRNRKYRSSRSRRPSTKRTRRTTRRR
jgi:hypothetical protein